MRILLVNPFYPISETPSPPLGLAYLAAALESRGHTVAVLDYVVFPYDRGRLARHLRDFRPRIVGVTTVTMTIGKAMEVLADVKAALPEALTVAGGPHVTFRADGTLAEHPCLDVVVKGEGEVTLVELAAAVADGRPPETVRGIAFRRGDAVHHTKRRPFIADIDDLAPPARHLLPLGRYRALRMPVSMITSRGCPFKCIFCVGRRMVGARVRYRRAEAVVDEMAALAGLGFHQINIADDLFTADPAHCTAVCDEILRRGLSVPWTAFARVDTVTLPVLKKMRAAGCAGVSFGVESGDPAILKTVKKGITLPQVEAAAAMCAAAGVTPYASFILGLPGETPRTLETTRAFARRLEALGVSYGYHLLAPFPGTRVREERDRYGLRILTGDWDRYHANQAIVETPSVSAGMLDAVVKRWRDRYDAYLGEIAGRMAEGAVSEEEAAPLVNLERTVLIYEIMMEGLVERAGTLSGDAARLSPSEALDRLAAAVARARKAPAGKIRDTLSWAAAGGHLELERRTASTVRWRWVGRLEEG